MRRKSNAALKRNQIDEVVAACRQIAETYLKNWKPIDKSWEVAEGCAYLRLSTEDQVTVEKGSLEQQVHIAINETANRSASDLVNYKITHFFIEPGYTGRDDKRPEFQAMKFAIKKRKHKFVVIKEIARIARDATIWKEFFNLCIENHCEILIRGFPFNPNDPAQIFQLDMLAAFAAYESNQNSKRLRESVFSAMISSGKFNATHLVLGLDQQIINGDPKVGFYVANSEELKTVEWIMRTFIKYASFQKTMEECEKNGVVNKNGQPFKKNSLLTLLTNKKYIGKWELNIENKDKNQKKLMPYEKYAEVDLPHGRVINLDLWNQVKDTIKRISGNKDKNTRISRSYLLSGLLQYTDGSPLSGKSGESEHTKERYYYYAGPSLKKPIPARLLEDEAMKIVGDIIKGAPRFKDCIQKRCSDVQSLKELLVGQAQSLSGKIAALESEKGKWVGRLDLLMDGASPDEIKNFRSEYNKKTNELNAEIASIETALKNIGVRVQEAEEDGFDWDRLSDQAVKIQKLVQENDPVALKNAYRRLFKAIVVGELDEKGNRALKFVLRGDDLDDYVNRADAGCVDSKLAQAEGIEPPTG